MVERQDPLCSAPKCTGADLGLALPDSPHATSVCLPLWEHVVGYEEGDAAVRDALQTGYPRFVLQPATAALFAQVRTEHGNENEDTFVFPSLSVAERCVAYMDSYGYATRIKSLDEHLHAVFFDEAHFDRAKSFWQHFGYITSSRRAAHYLLPSVVLPIWIVMGMRPGLNLWMSIYMPYSLMRLILIGPSPFGSTLAISPVPVEQPIIWKGVQCPRPRPPSRLSKN